MPANDAIIQDKNSLRNKLKIIRKNILHKDKLSQLIEGYLYPLITNDVMIYISIGSEVITSDIIQVLLNKNINVFAPYTVNGTIIPKRLIKTGVADRFGNLPLDCYRDGDEELHIDVCVTPLLGFNDGGYRIGYGAGCYDRFFETHNVKKIGLAYSAQKCEFNKEEFDIPLDCCVTENGVIYF